MSVTMMSRLMLNLHRSATAHSRNYDSSTTDFGSVVSTNMIFTSRLGTGGLPSRSVLGDVDTAGESGWHRVRRRSRSVRQDAEEFEMQVMR